jgi:hypothetical protein
MKDRKEKTLEITKKRKIEDRNRKNTFEKVKERNE